MISLARRPAEQLRDEATAAASSSSLLRDLSLVLDRAIQTGRVVVLQHHEQRALARLPSLSTNEQQFTELRQALARNVGDADA